MRLVENQLQEPSLALAYNRVVQLPHVCYVSQAEGYGIEVEGLVWKRQCFRVSLGVAAAACKKY